MLSQLKAKFVNKLRHIRTKYLFFTFPTSSPIYSIIQGEARHKFTKLCIFAHHSSANKIDNSVVLQLSQIAAMGYEILFISTIKRKHVHMFRSEESGKILPYVTLIILRNDIGRDFGSWKTGLLKSGLDYRRYDEILLTNDSYFGFFANYKKMFRSMQNADCDIWGITDSFETAYHIMSYFLVIRKSALNHPKFAEFWRRVRYLKSQYKSIIIKYYEIGFSQQMLRSGFKLAAYIPYDILFESGSRITQGAITQYALNPTHFFWRDAIVKYGCPIIKKDLLLQNPNKLNIKDWPQIIKNAGYNPQLIWEYLRH